MLLSVSTMTEEVVNQCCIYYRIETVFYSLVDYLPFMASVPRQSQLFQIPIHTLPDTVSLYSTVPPLLKMQNMIITTGTDNNYLTGTMRSDTLCSPRIHKAKPHAKQVLQWMVCDC